jgi:hypothetical protein
MSDHVQHNVMLNYLNSLPERERNVILAEAQKTMNMCFVPSPGPQTMAYKSKADLLLYGGQAAGGKTALVTGLALTAHNRSLIMRPQYTELADIIDKTLKFYGSRDGFNGSSPPSLKTRDGRFIQFGACANPGDEYAWQGQGHDLKCVGKDTPVLMADGTSKPIQEIIIGDMVQTLSGPKRVTRILPKRYDDAVEININGIKQVQSVTHEILTTSGWSSSAFLASACEPRLFDSAYRYAKLNAKKFLLGVRHRISHNYCLAQKTKPFQLFEGRLSSLASAFSCALSYPGIYSVLSYGVRQAREMFPLCSLFAKAPASFAHQYLSCTYRRLVSHDASYARSLSSLANCLASYLFLFRFYGERTLRHLGLLTSEVYALLYPHQLPGAADTSPNSSGYAGIDLEDTHKHTHHTDKYPHPYKREICLSRKHLFRSSYKVTPIGPRWLYDITVDEVNHFITHNAIVNKNCFDEVVNFREDQVRFIMTWNRTDIPGQRVRSIFASNPPINASGDWIIGMFRPWLDITHHNPAQDGELRWFITDKNGKDVEVDSNDPVPDGYNSDGTVRYRIPKSRTFIRASIDDNPYISADYKATLDAMKEPFRSAMRDGNFMLARKDTDNQCIPTDWIREAQSRWTPEIPKGVPMCAIGVDPAAGGPDETILAPRYDGYFPNLISVAGTDTPYPQDVAALTIRYRKGDAVPVIDCGGGYGGGIVRHLEDNGIKCVAHKGAEKSSKRSADRLYAFANKRAEVYWRFREALDPSQPGGSPIILPQDQKLMSDLCSVCYSITPRGIQLESKDDVKKRLGRSPDRGDAVVMAWSYGTSMANLKGGTFGGVKKIPQAVLGHMNKRRK